MGLICEPQHTAPKRDAGSLAWHQLTLQPSLRPLCWTAIPYHQACATQETVCCSTWSISCRFACPCCWLPQ